jgi:hypothetical protein
MSGNSGISIATLLLLTSAGKIAPPLRSHSLAPAAAPCGCGELCKAFGIGRAMNNAGSAPTSWQSFRSAGNDTAVLPPAMVMTLRTEQGKCRRASRQMVASTRSNNRTSSSNAAGRGRDACNLIDAMTAQHFLSEFVKSLSWVLGRPAGSLNLREG